MNIRGFFTIVFLFLAKSKYIFSIMKVLKTVKVLKPLITLGTMLLSVLAYGFAYNSYGFAIGLVLMLFIHEMGHVFASQRLGIKASTPIFIPFLGALIFTPPFTKRRDEAYCGFGGPLIGSLAALLCLFAWKFFYPEFKLLLLTGFVGLYLNLFNLIPISPLDGGRITQIVGGWFKWVGLALVGVLLAATREPGLILILIFVLDAFSMGPMRKSKTAFGLIILMTILMMFGYGEQKPWLDVVDIVIASLITGMYYLTDKREMTTGATSVVIYDDDRELTKADRIFWFSLWSGLSAVLVMSIFYFAEYLPKGVITPISQ
jgi:Zn-dependent protease